MAARIHTSCRDCLRRIVTAREFCFSLLRPLGQPTRCPGLFFGLGLVPNALDLILGGALFERGFLDEFGKGITACRLREGDGQESEQSRLGKNTEWRIAGRSHDGRVISLFP